MNSRAHLLAAAAAMALPLAAHAAITASMVPVQINSTLAANGWAGYVLRLTADVNSLYQITTVDFKYDVMKLGGTIGISGPVHQAGILNAVDFDPPQYVSTPILSGGLPSGTATRRDSTFLNGASYSLAQIDPAAEDNNHANGFNIPGNISTYNVSPLTDVPASPGFSNGIDYGVGSLMTFVGATAGSQQPIGPGFVDIAFILVPAGWAWVPGYFPSSPYTIQGAALDPHSQNIATSYAVQLTYILPEPGTLSIAMAGSLALLRRTRKNVYKT